GSPRFPKSVCAVVYQGAARGAGCQFTFTCDGSEARRPVPRLWSEAQQVAEAALDGRLDADIGGATNYHADYVSPSWRWSLVETRQIGRHIFYRPPEPGEQVITASVPGEDGAKPLPPRGRRGSRAPRRAPVPGPVSFSVWNLDVAQVSLSRNG